jgi:hypothetical protein
MESELGSIVTTAVPLVCAKTGFACSVEPPECQPGRIDWLFRYSLRLRQLHPLMEPIRHFRESAAP